MSAIPITLLDWASAFDDEWRARVEAAPVGDASREMLRTSIRAVHDYACRGDAEMVAHFTETMPGCFAASCGNHAGAVEARHRLRRRQGVVP